MRIRRWLAFLAAFLVVLVACLAAVSWWTWRRLHEPYRAPTVRGELRFEVRRGESASSILARLEREGLLWNRDLARLYLVHIRGDPSLKAGEYLFSEPLATSDVLEKLARGEVATHTVTVVEGLTLEETALHLAQQGFGDRVRFEEQMSRTGRIEDWDPDALSLEGYLFPDTYSFARGTTEAHIVDTMVETFRQRFEQEVRPLLSEAPARGDVRRLVILAAIVEKEARLDEERPLIAGVYENRLERGMGLYADPTIIYALKRLGTWDGNLRRRDLELDDPYNTYRYPGLPPGPICSPGLASLEAAARPADVPHLYFVSRNDGSHVFARTLAEHNRNVRKWQKEYWRKRWE